MPFHLTSLASVVFVWPLETLGRRGTGIRGHCHFPQNYSEQFGIWNKTPNLEFKFGILWLLGVLESQKQLVCAHKSWSSLFLSSPASASPRKMRGHLKPFSKQLCPAIPLPRGVHTSNSIRTQENGLGKWSKHILDLGLGFGRGFWVV